MTVPIAFLFCTSIVYPLMGWARQGRLALATWIAYCWLIVLGIAWIVKLFGDPRFW